MKKATLILIFYSTITYSQMLPIRSKDNVKKYTQICRNNIYKNIKGGYRKAGGAMKYSFMAPGSAQYLDQLWDWDSWWCNIALRQSLLESGNDADRKEAIDYERGCVLNFLNYGGFDGWIPYLLQRTDKSRSEQIPKNPFVQNMHKPCLAQHAAFLTKQNGGDAEWLREKFYELQAFENNYLNHHKHKPTGLVYWQTDAGIATDNDPSIFGRPDGSSASIFLNSLMYKELLAMAYLAERLNMGEIGRIYRLEADRLLAKVREHCWDERDGFFYTVDINLKPEEKPETWWSLHSGNPRNWEGLILRIDSWSGFTAMWAGVATVEQADRIVKNHYRDTSRFNAPAGIRTLSKKEKMYDVRATGNPSSWLGPVWIVSNYMVWKGLVKYGFTEDAKELAEKTVILLGRDFERFGALHENYLPDSGEPALNKGFQNWNHLVLIMASWLEGKPIVEEF